MITVYTQPSCITCHHLLEWLDQQGIKYTEMNAKSDPNISTTPTIDINGQRLVGFDQDAITEALQNHV